MRSILQLAFLIATLVASQVSANAQGFSMSIVPRTQPHATAYTSCFIHVTVSGTFTSSIYLRASAPTLRGARLDFYPSALNFPYQTGSQLVVTTYGAKPQGKHPVIIEGYNGPLLVTDTVYITSIDDSPWRTFDTQNSLLPSNEVFGIAVSPSGMGWVLTDKGLVSFDGSVWTEYPEISLADEGSDNYRDVTCDSSNGIWVSTDSTLFEYRNGVLTRHKRSFLNLYCAPDGTLWGSGSRRLGRYDGNDWVIYDKTNSQISVYGPMAQDKNGALWILGQHGVDRLHEGLWTRYETSAMGFQQFELKGITTDNEGEIWVVSHGGLSKYYSTHFQSVPASNIDTVIPGREPELMAIAKDSTKWITTRDQTNKQGGIGRYTPEKSWFYSSVNSQLSGGEIRALSIDKNNTIWIGTRSGLVLLDGNADADKVIVGVNDDLTEEIYKTRQPLITQIAPNPATSALQITVTIVNNGRVRLSVVNLLGQEIATLADDFFTEGAHPLLFDASELPSGVYHLRAAAGSVVESKQLVIHR